MTKPKTETKTLAPWVEAVVEAENRFKQTALEAKTNVVWRIEASFARQLLINSPKLRECDPSSIRDAIVNVAAIGLTLNPAEKLAHLVPRGGKCVLDISYMGLLKLATDTGSVMWAKAENVYSNDHFKWHGVNQLPTHDCDPFLPENERGEYVGTYCVAEIADDKYLCEVIPAEQMEAIKKTSAAQSGPWVSFPNEMRKKSAIKRAYKTWPKTKVDRRLDAAIDMLNQHEGLADMGRAVVVLAPDQVETIENMLEEYKVSKDLILTALKASSVDTIAQDDYDRAVHLITKASKTMLASKPDSEQPAQEATQ